MIRSSESPGCAERQREWKQCGALEEPGGKKSTNQQKLADSGYLKVKGRQEEITVRRH